MNFITQITIRLFCLTVRHTFSTDNEQFMNDILKMVKENADKLTSRNISNDFYEKGSLVLWGKMDRSVTKDRDLVKKCMEEFVAKMFETCPPNSEKETKCTIKLDIVKEIEGEVHNTSFCLA